jgi:NAD+ synthase (glutamine-hydrolysing)
VPNAYYTTSLPGKRGRVERVIRMIDRNEYERRHAPPGLKISPEAFGKDRRLPITNRYRE